jgi:predicted nucleotidyltransferase
MSERAVSAILEDHREEIRERFGVASLAVFGSAARGALTDESDVDLLVQFEGGATFDRFMGLKLYLEDLLDRQVDLVTPNALPPSLRSTVEQEGQRVA